MRGPDYTVLQELGRGSYGVVHQVRHDEDGKIYVVKLVNLTRYRSEKDKQQALAEVLILKQLSCPYIVKYYDATIKNGRLHIILEYCEEGDLKHYLQTHRDQLAERTIWRMFLCICMGLEYLHTSRILHRDIKSANIFLTANGGVRVGDMGLAKQLQNSMTAAATLCGSPAYLSPEQAKGTDHYTEKCDIWGLGIIVYELNSEDHVMPFRSTSLSQLLETIKSQARGNM